MTPKQKVSLNPIDCYLLLFERIGSESERRAMAEGTETPVLAELSIGFWVPECLVDRHFFVPEHGFSRHSEKCISYFFQKILIIEADVAGGIFE